MEPDIESTVASARTEEVALGLAVPTWGAALFVVLGGTLFHVWLHSTFRGVYNAHHVALAFFLVLNLLVNFWEIALFVCDRQIRDEYESIKDAYRGREMERWKEFFATSIPLLRVLSFREWARTWSTYALFDPGYADRRSFGWNIDVGNGFSTIIPAILFTFGMTFEIMPARILGIIGIAMFWQMLYGTIIYFFQFFHNGRHKGHSPGTIALFIGGTNCLWLIFPLWGIAVSVWMIMKDSYGIFF